MRPRFTFPKYRLHQDSINGNPGNRQGAKSEGKEGRRLKLELRDITKAKYSLQKVGGLTMTRYCWIWFQSRFAKPTNHFERESTNPALRPDGWYGSL